MSSTLVTYAGLTLSLIALLIAWGMTVYRRLKTPKASPSMLAKLDQHAYQKLNRLKRYRSVALVASLVFATCLWIGLLGYLPASGHKDSVENTKDHLYLLVDNSLSMDVKDVAQQNTRLSLIKNKLLSVASDQLDIPTTLVLYNSQPVRYPETTLLQARNYVATSQTVPYFATKGSSLGSALAEVSADIKNKLQGSKNDRYYLLVFSDGEETGEQKSDPETLASELSRTLTKSTIFGVGSESGGKVSYTAYDAKGQDPINIEDATSRLNTVELKSVASNLKGDYVVLDQQTSLNSYIPEHSTAISLPTQNKNQYYWLASILMFGSVSTYVLLPYIFTHHKLVRRNKGSQS